MLPPTFVPLALPAPAVDGEIGQLYGIEQEVRDVAARDRLAERRSAGAPVADALYDWLTAHRGPATAGTALAKAIDYNLNRWGALTRYLGDARLPIDNNHDEQQIRPWATGRNYANCAFMRTRHVRRAGPRSEMALGGSAGTSHNHSACRNCIKPLGGR